MLDSTYNKQNIKNILKLISKIKIQFTCDTISNNSLQLAKYLTMLACLSYWLRFFNVYNSALPNTQHTIQVFFSDGLAGEKESKNI